MKIVFMGTPDFAVSVLDRLVAEHEVVCVYTRAPKEAGRGKKICPSAVHQAAQRYGIEVRTPKTLRSEDEQRRFADLHADVAVVAAYGLLLPKAVLEACPKGCLNVHASLLPRWRGAAPIQRAIEAGDHESGVTIMRVVEALDAGPMYARQAVAVTPDMTGGALYDQLARIGADLICRVLQNLDTLTPQAQDESLVTYASKLEKEQERLDFSLDADILARKIRAFNPFPAVFFEYRGERFKVLEARVTDMQGNIGELIVKDRTVTICCGKGALCLLQLQRQGKRAMSVAELLNGFTFENGAVVQ
jgi:methionyl-tRNA formyltransferase